MATNDPETPFAARGDDARPAEEARGDERSALGSPLATGLAPWDLLPPDLLLVRRRPVPR